MNLNIETDIIKDGDNDIYVAIDTIEENVGKELPVIIIPPAFSKTMRDYFMFSLYLAANNFTVLRYDTINHVGLSSGTIYDFKLSDCIYTLEKVSQYARQRFSGPISILGTSLAGRVVLKHLSMVEKDRYSFVSLLLPVVNVSDTIRRVSSIDYFKMEYDGVPVKEANILDNIVSFDYVRDAIRNDFSSIETSWADLEKIDVPMTVFVAAQDEWVDFEQIKEVFMSDKRPPSLNLVAINFASHHLERNLQAAKLIQKNVVESYTNHFYGEGHEVVLPGFRDVVRNSSIDRSREYQTK